MKVIKGTRKELRVLKDVCIMYKSSPYLTNKQKETLINEAIKPFEEVVK